MTISDQLIDINNSKLAIKAAIEAKGQTVGNAPFSEYANKISLITTGAPASVTPTITSSSIYYFQGSFFINVSSYTDTAFYFEIRNTSNQVVINDSAITFDIVSGNATFSLSTLLKNTTYYIYAYAQKYGFSPSTPAVFSFTVSDQTTYRYWRLTSFVMPTGNVQLNELHFYSGTNASGTAYPPTMTSDIAPAPYVVTRSYAYSSTYEGWKAFDNTSYSYWWLLSRSAAQQLTDWVQIDLGSEINVKSIKIQYSSGPTSSKLYASNTGAFTGEQVLMHTFSNALTQTVG